MGAIRDFLGLGPSKAELRTKLDSLTDRHLKARSERHAPQQSGVPLTFGQFEYETNSKLRGDSRWEVLAKMEHDPAVKAAIRKMTLPLVNAEWKIEPASDDPRDIEIAEFVSANLLRQSSDKFGRDYWAQSSWKGQRLPEILRVLPDGFSMFAKSTRVVGTKVVYDRVQWLEPSSVDPRGWELTDTDELIRVKRTYNSNNKFKFWEPIEAAQIALYVHELFGARWEGRPFTRAMYGAWMRKEYKQRMEAFWTQKAGAPPAFGWYPKGFPPDQLERFEEYVQAMAEGRNPDRAWMMGPMGTDNVPPAVGFVSSGTDHVDRMKSVIESENSEIARAGENKAAMLGETETGSRALGSTQGMTDMIAVEALAGSICEQITHGVGNLPGEIEELVDWNYSGVQSYPQLVCSKVNPFQMQQQADRQIVLFEKGIVPKVPAVRQQMAEGAGFNLPDDAYEIEEPEPPQMPPGSSGQPPVNRQVPSNSPDQQGDDDASRDGEMDRAAAVRLGERVDDFRARIAPMLEPGEDAPSGGRFRAQTRLELACLDLAAIRDTMRVGERDMLNVTRATQRAMVDELMGRLRAGKITRRSVESQRRSKFKGGTEAQDAMVSVMEEIGAAGAAHVEDELERLNRAD